MVPACLLLAWLLTRLAPPSNARFLAAQLLLFGLLYPCVAGLDPSRQSLYFNLSAVAFLALAGWQMLSRSIEYER
jgi:hypothetical protein